MAFLPKAEIQRRSAEIFDFDSYDPNSVDTAGYNLRLGPEAFISTGETPYRLTDENPMVAIHPGEFGLLTTYEYLKIPKNLIAFITLRHRYKKQGLINVSGFHVDPGFEGKLVFSVYNVGRSDIVLRFKDGIFMIFFAIVNPEAIPEPQKHIHHKQKSLSLEDMLSIRGPSMSLVHLEGRMRDLEGRFRFYGAIITGILLAMFAFVARLVFK